MHTMAQPTHLAEIVRRESTHMGFCDASGIGAGSVWLDPSRSGPIMVWSHPWLTDTIAALISNKIPWGH